MPWVLLVSGVALTLLALLGVLVGGSTARPHDRRELTTIQPPIESALEHDRLMPNTQRCQKSVGVIREPAD